MPALWVTSYRSLSSPTALAAYGALAVPAVLAGGGRFIARGLPAAAFEAGQLERTVVIEFPSVEAAVATYNSPAYKLALAALGDTAVRDLRIIEMV
jgi:uncharacterized protein (DUF1330 family)